MNDVTKNGKEGENGGLECTGRNLSTQSYGHDNGIYIKCTGIFFGEAAREAEKFERIIEQLVGKDRVTIDHYMYGGVCVSGKYELLYGKEQQA